MEKMLISLSVVVGVMFMFLSGCNSKVPSGPLAVNTIVSTVTQSVTPNAVFKVIVSEAGTPVPSIEVKIAPQGVTTMASVYTNALGTAVFGINNGGQWELRIPGQNGYDSLYYLVEPMSNTVYAVELGTQSISLELVSGNVNLPISPSTLQYKLTYHCTKSKQYNITFINGPSDLTITTDSLIVRNDNDKINFSIAVPKSYEGVSTVGNNFYVNAVAIQGGKAITSTASIIRKNWAYNVDADVKFAKTYVDPAASVLFAPFFENGKTIYWIGAKNYNTDVQNFYVSGSVKIEYASHQFTGDIAVIQNTYLNQNDIDLEEGHYENLVKAESEGGSAWVKTHDAVNGSITMRFYDDGYLDVIRTFSVAGDFGVMCGSYLQKTGNWGIQSSPISFCGDFPSVFGYSYCSVTLKKSKAGHCVINK